MNAMGCFLWHSLKHIQHVLCTLLLASSLSLLSCKVSILCLSMFDVFWLTRIKNQYSWLLENDWTWKMYSYLECRFIRCTSLCLSLYAVDLKESIGVKVVNCWGFANTPKWTHRRILLSQNFRERERKLLQKHILEMSLKKHAYNILSSTFSFLRWVTLLLYMFCAWFVISTNHALDLFSPVI